MSEHAAHIGKIRVACEMSYVNLMGSYKDNIKMDPKELGFEYVDRI
jgi:hypothetical protein